MCFRLLIALVVGFWLVRMIHSYLFWQSCRKEIDRIISTHNGMPERIDALLNMLKNKAYINKKDRARLERLLTIRDEQIRGVRHVDSKVKETGK